MTTEYSDKESVRQSLPLAFACAVLGVNLDAEGKGLCPFHDDGAPSFTLWTDDAGVERWHCFPCDSGGDVFDLIRRIDGLGFDASISRAQDIATEVPAGYRDRTPKPSPTAIPVQDWPAIVEEASARAATSDNDGWLGVAANVIDPLLSAPHRKGMDHRLREVLHWGVTANGDVVMPHYDAANQLTGIKYRSMTGHRWTEPGSTFRALYGSWIPRRSQFVLIVEGETDMAYAYLQTPKVDVLALPRGAASFNDDWRSLEAEIYFLAFDADEAGLRATMKWLAAFDDGDVRICRLPRGQDLRAVQPNISDMLRHAVTPRQPAGQIQVAADRFLRITNNGPRELTSWYVEPTARLDGEGDPALEVDVHANGQEWSDVLKTSDLTNASKFRAWAAERSLDCMATDADVVQLLSYLLTLSIPLPEVFQTSRAGVQAPPDRYAFAGKAIITPDESIGQLPWRYVGPADVQGHISLPAGKMDWSWFTDLFELNDLNIVTPILAWFAAAARRDELRNFPLLYLSGSSGSGKTTMANLISRMFGSSLQMSLASATPFTLNRLFGTTTTFPVFIDEWTRQARTDAREAIQAAITTLYEGGVMTRGRADLSVQEFHLTSPVIIAGEDEFNLTRESDRTVTVRLSRESQGFDAFQRLARQPIEHFARWYYQWIISTPNLPAFTTTAPLRPEYNRLILEAGWQTLSQYLDYCGEYEDVPVLPDLDLTQLETQKNEIRENEYETFVVAGRAFRDSYGNALVWEDPQGEGTYVRFQHLVSDENMRRVDIELPGRSRAMKSYFKDRYQTIDSQDVPIPYTDRTVRATLVLGFHAAHTDPPALESNHD